MNKTIAIIPARSGSKGVKDKNIRLICGYPLLAYSIAAAKLCDDIDRVIVSTDSEEYAEVAIKYGAEVPFLRPNAISSDTSLDIEYLQFTLQELEHRENYMADNVVLLRPTTPLRDSNDILKAIHILNSNNNATAVVSVQEALECPYKWVEICEDGYIDSPFNNLEPDDVNLPRQSFQKLYIPDGYVDVLRSSEIINHGKVYGNKAIPWINLHTFLDIDTQEDIDNIDASEIMESEIYKFLSEIF